MPVRASLQIRRMPQEKFGELSFEVMRHVFAIHNQIGRFFDEKIYKRELAHRMPDVHLEVPVEVWFNTFRKKYFLDVLVGQGGLFEFKAVEALNAQHRAQLLHYLLIGDLSHGKLINVRTEDVQHEFVNTHWTHADRVRFEIQSVDWTAAWPCIGQLRELLIALLQDVGTGLTLGFYEEVVAHFLKEAVEAEADVIIGNHRTGHQRVRLLAPGIAWKITGFDEPLDAFEVHARRLLAHIDLRAIAWVNINMKKVIFTMLEK